MPIINRLLESHRPNFGSYHALQRANQHPPSLKTRKERSSCLYTRDTEYMKLNRSSNGFTAHQQLQFTRLQSWDVRQNGLNINTEHLLKLKYSWISPRLFRSIIISLLALMVFLNIFQGGNFYFWWFQKYENLPDMVKIEQILDFKNRF